MKPDYWLTEKKVSQAVSQKHKYNNNQKATKYVFFIQSLAYSAEKLYFCTANCKNQHK